MGVKLVRREPASSSALRRELALDLQLHGIDEQIIDEVALVASELVANAVRHSGFGEADELDVSWTLCPDAVVVAVDDHSAELPAARTATSEETSGRGLKIIAALTTAWGYERTPRGKRVWAKISRTAPTS